jgi:hypothetical protein
VVAFKQIGSDNPSLVPGNWRQERAAARSSIPGCIHSRVRDALQMLEYIEIPNLLNTSIGAYCWRDYTSPTVTIQFTRSSSAWFMKLNRTRSHPVFVQILKSVLVRSKRSTVQ